MSVEKLVEYLPYIVGLVLSLVFSYFPKLNVWFASNFLEEERRAIMLALNVVAALILFGLGCGNVISPVVSCDKAGLLIFGDVLFKIALANQVTFKLSPKLTAVKLARLD